MLVLVAVQFVCLDMGRWLLSWMLGGWGRCCDDGYALPYSSLSFVFGRGMLLGNSFLVEVCSSIILDINDNLFDMGGEMKVALAVCLRFCSRDRLLRGECPRRSWGPGLFDEVGVLILAEFLMASHRHHSWLPPSVVVPSRPFPRGFVSFDAALPHALRIVVHHC